MNTTKTLVKFLLPLIILSLGVVGGWQIYQSKRKIKKSRPASLPPLVETLTVEKAVIPITLNAMGTVVPERTIALKPEVSGRIMELGAEFIPGGRFRQGESILVLDPADFELVIQKQLALESRARAALALEKGKQDVAREDLALMQTTTGRILSNTDLALRKPQMDQALADLASVRADLAQARLNLSRTRVIAPFNAMVLERNVDRGSRVSTSETLATLVGTDRIWVEVAVPVGKIARIRFPGGGQGGSMVQVITASGRFRRGEVIRLKADINPATRMATVIVAVDDPFALGANGGKAPLLLDSYVDVRIQAHPLADAVALPRSAFRNGGQVWLYREGVLEKRELTPVFSDGEFVYVTQGLSMGEEVILTDLATPVKGMKLRKPGEVPKASMGGGMGKKSGRKLGTGRKKDALPGEKE